MAGVEPGRLGSIQAAAHISSAYASATCASQADPVPPSRKHVMLKNVGANGLLRSRGSTSIRAASSAATTPAKTLPALRAPQGGAEGGGASSWQQPPQSHCTASKTPHVRPKEATSCSQVEGPQGFEHDSEGGEGDGGGGDGGGGGCGGGVSSEQQPVQLQPALTNALHVSPEKTSVIRPHAEDPQLWLHAKASYASYGVGVVALTKVWLWPTRPATPSTTLTASPTTSLISGGSDLPWLEECDGCEGGCERGGNGDGGGGRAATSSERAWFGLSSREALAVSRRAASGMTRRITLPAGEMRPGRCTGCVIIGGVFAQQALKMHDRCDSRPNVAGSRQ